MKSYFSLINTLLLTFCLTSFNGFSSIDATKPQDSTVSIMSKASSKLLVDQGKQLLVAGRSRDALTKFREAMIKDRYNSKAVFWLAQTHYSLSNYGYALKYARQSEEINGEVDGDIAFLLGEVYHRMEKLDSARNYYVIALNGLSRGKRRNLDVKGKIEQVDYAKNALAIEKNYNLSPINGNVNSGYNDYSPVLSHDGLSLYFVSRRPDTQDGGLNPDDQQFFEDIYLVKRKTLSDEWDGLTNDLERLNSPGFDAVNYLSKDGLQMYLTVNTSIVDVPKPTRGSDICVSEYTNLDRWTVPKAISNKDINTSFFEGGATLTDDGNTMYFVSDRDGNKSKMDIYVTHRSGNNWGEVKKLPKIVNSKGNETTPFITPDGKYLFFSSDGHLGMGGYDIFVTKNLGNNQWSRPVNLGAEFNSVNDDTHFKYYSHFNKALMASFIIVGQKASMNILEIDLEGWEIPVDEEDVD